MGEVNTVIGVKEWKAVLRQIPKEVKKDLAAAINESARELRGELRAAAPVDTGFLRKSIRVSKRATTRKLRAVVPMWFYGRFLDLGIKTGKYKGWAANVIESAREKHTTKMRTAIEAALKKTKAIRAAG